MQSPNMRIGATAGQRALPRKIAFTTTSLERLACPPGKPRVLIYDSKTKGLAIQVTQTGAKSFYFYGRVKGQRLPVKYHLGNVAAVSLDQARRAAMKVASDAAHGVNPADERRAAAEKAKLSITLRELWTGYLEQHLKPNCSPRLVVVDTSQIKHLSVWYARPIASINRQSIEDLHRSITVKKTTHTADATVLLLRRMLTWGKVDPNPAFGVKLHGGTQRTRFLTSAELQRLMTALDECPNETAADIIRFALLTGARKSNVCGAKWSDIQREQGLWIIPGNESKNGKPMTIHLSPPTVDLLNTRAEMYGDRGYVFPGRNSRQPFKNIHSQWVKIRTKVGITDVHFHDLRHTLASWMAMHGASLLVIGRQLGHTSKASTARYAHLEIDAVRAATNAATAMMVPTRNTTAAAAEEKAPDA